LKHAKSNKPDELATAVLLLKPSKHSNITPIGLSLYHLHS